MFDIGKVSSANFIKLGERGNLEKLSIESGTIRLLYNEVPHAMGMDLDAAAIKKLYGGKGLSKGTATSHANQVLQFYSSGTDVIWITFYGGFMWWTVAEGPVKWLGGSEGDMNERGSRMRHTVDGWHNKSLGGALLYENKLSGNLTKVKRFQGTICDVKELKYLIRKITDKEMPQVIIAKDVRQEMLHCIVDLMKMLTPQDFELLVDLIYSQSGWRRLNLTGGVTKVTDLELELPTTGEKAFVQVKSSTNQAQFDDYIAALDMRYETRMFYVYHTLKGSLKDPPDNVTIIDGLKLAEMTLGAGLFDWLLRKAG